MTDDDEIRRKAVVFIDSLGPDDLEHMPWVRENMALGTMDAGPVYVTPVVLGSIYTGTSPSEHGLPAVSRYEQNPRLRPAKPTIPEIAAAAEEYENVAQVGWPFLVPPQADVRGNYWHASEAMGQSSFLPAEAQAPLTIPGPAGRMDLPDENVDLLFNLRVDHAMTTFATARNMLEMWDLDLLFLGYRVTDSYCHYHYPEPEDAETTYRQDLLQQIDQEIKYLSNQAEVFLFGDHGAMEMDEVFRLNRWLIERGYLDVEIDTDFHEKAQEYGMIEVDEEVPGDVFSVGTVGVTVNEEASTAVGADPFSTGITLLDGATEETTADLIAELSAVDGIETVATAEELFGPGELLEECPDLYAVRKPGVFVSGNLAPEMGGVELTRSGVHHPFGAFGSTEADRFDGRTTPTGLFDLIARDFLDLPVDDVQELDVSVPEQDLDAADKREIRDNLADLGYL